MKQHHFAIASLMLGCSAGPAGQGAEAGSGIGSLSSPTGGMSSAMGTDDASGDATAGPNDETANPTGADTMGGPKYDVGIETYCQIHGGGIHCDENVAIECTVDGNPVTSENCDPDICLPDVGCVVCEAGQYNCMGDKVMVCNAAAVPPAWQLVEVCDPAAGEGCDLELGACAVLQPVGTNIPTGEYYQFADLQMGATPFLGGYDVESFEDNIYVLNYNTYVIDAYTIELLDSDMDGKLEPNQHPDNPDALGEIEQRVLTYVQSYASFGTPSPSVSEIYAVEDRIYLAGSQLTEYVFGGATQVVTTPPGWSGGFSHVGYDDVRGIWYASNEGARRVFQYDAATSSWGIAFLYPELAGDHMDGLEVVTDVNTNIPYVYVSDMTSDFIGQYKLDPELGWVQNNLFSYAGTAGAPLEGMGFGALYHFWATSGNSLYEIGGGDLAEFTEPPG